MLKPLSGAELHAARKAAAERFALIAYRRTPDDVVVKYRRALSGVARVSIREIEVPEPTTRRRLHIYLHEVAHIVLNHNRTKPRHVEEMEAEKWAFQTMREEGVAVPRKSLKRAKGYVARKIRQAQANGAKSINREALAFAFD